LKLIKNESSTYKFDKTVIIINKKLAKRENKTTNGISIIEEEDENE